MARTLTEEELPALDRPLRFVVTRGARGAARGDTLGELQEELDGRSPNKEIARARARSTRSIVASVVSRTQQVAFIRRAAEAERVAGVAGIAERQRGIRSARRRELQIGSLQLGMTPHSADCTTYVSRLTSSKPRAL